MPRSCMGYLVVIGETKLSEAVVLKRVQVRSIWYGQKGRHLLVKSCVLHLNGWTTTMKQNIGSFFYFCNRFLLQFFTFRIVLEEIPSKKSQNNATDWQEHLQIVIWNEKIINPWMISTQLQFSQALLSVLASFSLLFWFPGPHQSLSNRNTQQVKADEGSAGKERMASSS